MNLKDKLDISKIEAKWQKIWRDEGTYKWNKNKSKEEIFSIDTPPPTISGALHMGHVFSYTQTDFIARFQRMNGKSVFYPIGFDNNGLPTERLVEKIKKIRAKDLSREDFIKICKEVVLETEEKYTQIFKSLGLSFDWEQKYQTISTQSRKLSQMSFLDLYNKGRIVRKFGPNFWDVTDQTAVTQAESINKKQIGILYDIKFKTSEGKDVTIATTRPEMLPACVAIFYHPQDLRYKQLNGKKILVPLFNNEVNILPDDAVKQEKGTGLVMCSTFGDIQDIDWWRKYKLETKECINLYGKMQNAGFLDNMKIKDAQEIILKKLKEEGCLIKQQEVVQNVKYAERSGTILAIIPTYQWYIEVLPYKKQLHKKNNECNWYPKFMKKRLTNWIQGLNQDWCISRQRYFGVPFPVWYSKRRGKEGKILLADMDQLPVDPYLDLPKGYSRNEIEAEIDVMDTWATSALTPQLSSHAISDKLFIDKDRYKKLFPFDLRAQAHEIIRTWTFGTIVKSMFHQDSIPWKNLMISGWCLTADKSKMSKSKKGTTAPEKLLSKQGADIIRYWASNSKLGMDIVYNEQILKIGKKLITKLWNAAKFVNTHHQNLEFKAINLNQDIIEEKIFCDLDLWIISNLYKVIENSTKALEIYEYCDARTNIENFFWKDFCDNYLELIKTRVYDEKNKSRKRKNSAILTLHYVFQALLRLFAPYIPHITEEINLTLFANKNLITQIDTWPKLENYYFNKKYLELGKNVLNILELVRRYKSINRLSLRTEIKKVIYSNIKFSKSALIDLKNATNCKTLHFSNNLKANEKLKSNCGKYSILIS